MADPVTWAYIAVSVIGAAQSADSARRANNTSADMARTNAIVATQQGDANAAAQHRRNLMLMGAQVAQAGASGTVASEGSALDVIASSAAQGALDEQTIKYNSKIRARGYTDTATLDNMAAKNQQTAGQLKAGSEILSGGSTYLNRQPPSQAGTTTGINQG